jgi:hypothetical protein
VEAKVGQLEAKLEAVESKVGQVEAKVDRVEAGMADVKVLLKQLIAQRDV